MTTDGALTRRQRWTVGGFLLVVVLFSGLRFDGPTRGYWDTYIAVPAMFMTGQAVDLVRQDGTPRYEYQLAGRVPDDTYDPTPGSFGIASADQRIGTCVLFGAPFALFAMAAFRWVYAAFWAFTALFGFLSIRRLLAPLAAPDAPAGGAGGAGGDARVHEGGGGFWIPLLGAALLVFNPFSLYLDRLNGNTIGLAILTFLFFLLQERRPPWWLIGLVYGLLGGIRNEAIVLGPLFVAWLWWRRRGARGFLVDLATFTATAFVGILPVLLWNRFAYGEMLIHPSQVAHLEGFRPTFPHRFFGAEFEFNGLLNWPFHDRLVRTPHFAYPTFLTWPLVTVKALGVLLSAAGAVGAVALVRRRRREGLALLFWYLVVYALFFFQENWEELKQTFLALHLFPLVAFVAVGVRWVADRPRSAARWGTTLGLAAALALLVWSARWLEVPADERWYVRFPHAAGNESGLAELPENLRKDWHYFYTRETPAEVERERRTLATPCPLPALYRPFEPPVADNLARIAREPFQREHRTLAIWSYIYE
jgi:hypothetical protein